MLKIMTDDNGTLSYFLTEFVKLVSDHIQL